MPRGANSSLGDRPIVCAREVRVPGAPPMPGAARSKAERELDPAWQVAAAEWTLAAHSRPGDTLPGVSPDFANGIGLPAAFLDAELDYRPEATWVKEMPDDYERDLPGFSADHPVFKSLNESLRRLAMQCSDRAVLTVPWFTDSLTTLSLLRGAEGLLLDLIDRPDDVKRVCAHIDKPALDAHAAWWRTMADAGLAESLTWADVYWPGKVEMLQSDICVNLSPAMFDEFVLPSLRLWSEYFDRACYHLDGAEQYRFIDRFCGLPGIQTIQWQPGDMHRNPMKWLAYLKDIRKRGRAVWVMAFDTEAPVRITEELGPDGLMFYVRDVASAADIDRMLERMVAVCR
ncbi:MAG: hypothetical protein ABIF71_14550 [Planctomycetota bacterium]